MSKFADAEFRHQTTTFTQESIPEFNKVLSNLRKVEENIEELYSKYQDISKVNLILETICYLLSITSFNLAYRQNNLWSHTNLICLISVSVFKILSLLVFFLSNYFKNEFDKEYGKTRGYIIQGPLHSLWFYVEWVLLAIHPMWFLRGFQNSFEERFFDD